MASHNNSRTYREYKGSGEHVEARSLAIPAAVIIRCAPAAAIGMSARSPPQQTCFVSRVVAVKRTTIESPAEEKFRLDVRVYEEGDIEGRMKAERIVLKSQRAGTGLKSPGQQHLLSWEMRETTADGCSLAGESSKLGGTTYLQAVVRIEPDDQTSQ